MSKHTSGPWTWEYSNDTGPNDDYFIEFFEIRSQDGIKIAEVAEQEDARLIAAAPDLLEALESVWLWMENQADGQSKGGHATFDLLMLREQRDIARAAIAKATGEQQ